MCSVGEPTFASDVVLPKLGKRLLCSTELKAFHGLLLFLLNVVAFACRKFFTKGSADRLPWRALCWIVRTLGTVPRY